MKPVKYQLASFKSWLVRQLLKENLYSAVPFPIKNTTHGFSFKGDMFLPHNGTKEMVHGLWNDVLWCSCILLHLPLLWPLRGFPHFEHVYVFGLRVASFTEGWTIDCSWLHLWKKRLNLLHDSVSLWMRLSPLREESHGIFDWLI